MEPDPSKVSKYERAVLDLLVQGLSNAEIGELLLRSEKTIITRIYKLMKWTGLNNRVKLSVWWVKSQKCTKNERKIMDYERDALILANARRLIKAKRRTSNAELYMELFGTGYSTANNRCLDLGLDPDSNETSYNAMIKYLNSVTADSE